MCAFAGNNTLLHVFVCVLPGNITIVHVYVCALAVERD